MDFMQIVLYFKRFYFRFIRRQQYMRRNRVKHIFFIRIIPFRRWLYLSVVTRYNIWIWIMFRNKQKILRKNIERTNGWNAGKYETFFFSFRLPISRYRYFRVSATAGRLECVEFHRMMCVSSIVNKRIKVKKMS